MVTIIPAFSDNYMYAVQAETGVVIIDPSEAKPVIDRGLKPIALWCTHHHPDHVSGISELLQHYGQMPVLGSAYDLQHARIDKQTQGVDDGEEVVAESVRARVFATPGHTLGAVCYLIGDALFTGDTLFIGGCGRLFEGTAEQMFATLSRLRALPDATRIYCGHEYAERNLAFAAALVDDVAEYSAQIQTLRAHGKPSVPQTLANEKRSNPMLRFDDAKISAAVSASSGVATFVAVRKRRDAW